MWHEQFLLFPSAENLGWNSTSLGETDFQLSGKFSFFQKSLSEEVMARNFSE